MLSTGLSPKLNLHQTKGMGISFIFIAVVTNDVERFVLILDFRLLSEFSRSKVLFFLVSWRVKNTREIQQGLHCPDHGG